jgi:hypothetical protein
VNKEGNGFSSIFRMILGHKPMAAGTVFHMAKRDASFRRWLKLA